MARLTRLYTRSGDQGQTSLADGRRLPKTHPRVAALGDLDELNATLGWVRAQTGSSPWEPLLRRLQHRLFDLGGALALPGHPCPLDEAAVNALEEEIDRLNDGLPPLKEFLLPGPPPAAAAAHLARAQCRRAERSLWRLHAQEPVEPSALAWINRLSDLLFVLARRLAQGETETTWRPIS